MRQNTKRRNNLALKKGLGDDRNDYLDKIIVVKWKSTA